MPPQVHKHCSKHCYSVCKWGSSCSHLSPSHFCSKLKTTMLLTFTFGFFCDVLDLDEGENDALMLCGLVSIIWNAIQQAHLYCANLQKSHGILVIGTPNVFMYRIKRNTSQCGIISLVYWSMHWKTHYQHSDGTLGKTDRVSPTGIKRQRCWYKMLQAFRLKLKPQGQVTSNIVSVDLDHRPLT